MAQDSRPTPRHRSPGRVRQRAAAALAAAGAWVGLPPGGGLRAQADQRSPSATSSSRRPKGSTWTWWIAARRGPRRGRRCRCAWCYRRAPSTRVTRRSRGRLGSPRRDHSHDRGSPALTATGADSGQLGAHRHDPRLEKGGRANWFDRRTVVSIRQNKHHRWSLDEAQIYQYHLGGALHPHIRWLEAMDVPRREIQFIELGEELTLVSLVCEDLAQYDDVAEVIRSVGPTLVVTLLARRTAARFALGGPVCERAGR